jgi:hypothetical protein
MFTVQCSNRADEQEEVVIQLLSELEDTSALLVKEIVEMPFEEFSSSSEAVDKDSSIVADDEPYLDDDLAASLAALAKAKMHALSLIRASKGDAAFRLKSEHVAQQNIEWIEDLLACERTRDETIDVLDEVSAAKKKIEVHVDELRELSEAQRTAILNLSADLEEATATLTQATAPEMIQFFDPAEQMGHPWAVSHPGRSYSLNQAYLRGYHDASWWEHPDDVNNFREKCLGPMKINEEISTNEALAIEKHAYHEGFDAGKNHGRFRKKVPEPEGDEEKNENGWG